MTAETAVRPAASAGASAAAPTVRGGGIPRVDVLGVGISAIDMPDAIAEIARWIDTREAHYVCVTGVHGVMESQRDEALRAIHNESGLTTPDGMPMVWAAHAAGATWVRRVYGPDLMLALLGAGVERGWRHFLYGGGAGTPERLAERLRERIPGVRIAGTYSPPFRPLTEDEDRAVVEMIDASDADVVWVGLSTPKQERWMAAHVGRVGAPALLGVGAAFDIHAGRVPQAPPWVRNHGLEWLYRLVQEPGRLWRRYLTNNPRFVWAIARRRPRLRATTSPDGSAAAASPVE